MPISLKVADQYVRDKELYESGKLDLSQEEVDLRRTALADLGAELERQEKRRREKLLEEYFADLATLGGNFGEKEEEAYRLAPDKDEIKARMALSVLFSDHYNLSSKEVNEKFQALRLDYANQRFNGKIPKTDVEFYHAEKTAREKEATQQKEAMSLVASAAGSAFADAVKRQGPNWATSFKQWQEKAGELSILKENAPEKIQVAYRKAHAGAFELLERNPVLVEVLQMMAKKAGRRDLLDPDTQNPQELFERRQKWIAENEGKPKAEPTTEKILERLMQVPEEDLQKFLDLVPAYLQMAAEGDEASVRTFLGQFFGEVAHGLSTMSGPNRFRLNEMERYAKELRAIQEGQTVYTWKKPGEKLTPGSISFTTEDRLYRPLTDAERLEAVEVLKKSIGENLWAIRLQGMMREMKPLRAVSEFESAEIGLYALAGSLPMMGRSALVTMIPGVGLLGRIALSYFSSADAIKAQEFERLILEFPDIDVERASKTAAWSGAVQAVPELLSTYALKAGGSILARKAPSMAKALEKFAEGPRSGFWRPFATRTTLGTGEDVLEEGVQGVFSAVVQNAVLDDYPHVDPKKAFLDNISPEVAFASLFMRLPAAGAGTWHEAQLVRTGMKSFDMVRGLGLNEEDAREVNRLAHEGKYAEAERLMHEKYDKLSPEQIVEGARRLQRRLDEIKQAV